jgi:hypothetical protein
MDFCGSSTELVFSSRLKDVECAGHKAALVGKCLIFWKTSRRLAVRVRLCPPFKSEHLTVIYPWPKTLPDFLMPELCFTGISRSSLPMAEDYPFRPCGIHDNAKPDREDSQSAP